MERKTTVRPPVETRRSRGRRDVALPLSAWVPRLTAGR